MQGQQQQVLILDGEDNIDQRNSYFNEMLNEDLLQGDKIKRTW